MIKYGPISGIGVLGFWGFGVEGSNLNAREVNSDTGLEFALNVFLSSFETPLSALALAEWQGLTQTRTA